MRITKKFLESLNKQSLKSLTEDEVVRLLKKANDAYRTKGEPIMSDDMYDMIMEHLEGVNPSNPFLKKVGDAPASKVKAKLPFYMGSLDKIKTDERLIEKFKSTYSCSYMVSEKLDGNSALLVVDGASKKLYSRGDGVYGQDISHLLKYVQNVQAANAGDFMAVRGELIISRADFQLLRDKGANARNMVAGIVNAKTPDVEIAKHIQFVAYELLEPSELSPEIQSAQMKKKGLKVVKGLLVGESALTSENLSNILIDARATSEFEVDGIVVMHNAIHKRIAKENPKYAFAFKSVQTMDKAEVIVTDIEWNVSKDGYMIPVVQFHPVHLAGVTIQRAHGFNGKYIKDNNLGPGSRIVIMRSGDVIPYILEVLTPSESKKPMMPPQSWHWSDSGVDIILDNLATNDDVLLKNLQYFFDKIDVKGVSSGTIKKLYDAGFKDIKSILSMTKTDLLTVDGIKDKSAVKVLTALKEAFDNVECLKLMDASNTLGRGVGSKKLAPVIEAFPKVLTHKYVPTTKELVSIKGIEKKTAETISQNLPKFFDFLEATGIKCAGSEKEIPKTSKGKDTDKSSKLKDMSFVFSGVRDKDLEQKIEELGGSTTGSVTKKTTAIIVKDVDSSASKVEKAKELGIPIHTIETFTKHFL
jgi:NAD-dependent DNA ligase